MKHLICSLISILFLATTAMANESVIFDLTSDKVDVAKLLSRGLTQINETFALSSKAQDAVLYAQSRSDLNNGSMKTELLVAVKIQIPGQEMLLAAYSIDANGVETLGLVSANPDGKIVYSEPENKGILYFGIETTQAVSDEYAKKLNQAFANLNAQGSYSGFVEINLTRDLEKVIQSVKSDGATFQLDSGMYLATTVLKGPFKISKTPAIQKFSDIMKARIPVTISDFGSDSISCSANF